MSCLLVRFDDVVVVVVVVVVVRFAVLRACAFGLGDDLLMDLLMHLLMDLLMIFRRAFGLLCLVY